MNESSNKNCNQICGTCCSTQDEISECSDSESNAEKSKCCKCGKFCKGQVTEYFSKSGIHGFQYLAERQRPLYERILWGIVLVISFYGGVNGSYNIWKKWNESPVIVTFNEKATPIWKIPFPAITICPETKTLPQTFNYTHFYKIFSKNGGNLPSDVTQEEFRRMRAVSQVCLDNPAFNLTSNDEFDIIKTLDTIGLDPATIFPACRWKIFVKNRQCNDLLVKTVTEDGICYTFNSLDFKDIFRDEILLENESLKNFSTGKQAQWDLENGYEPSVDAETLYPHRVISAGYIRGLHIILRGYERHSDYICRGGIQGFKVVFHSPNELPQISKNFLRMQYGKEIFVSVKPNMMTTSNVLKDYTPEQRQCFFNDQRFLRYFKIYTKNNCEAECLTNHTINECGCVHFSMPKPKNVRVCGAADMRCYSIVKGNYLMHEFKKELQKSDDRCNCLPACTSLSYDTETTHTKFDYQSITQSFKSSTLNKRSDLQMSRLVVNFKDDDFITSRRSELYGTTDFLASCGGILGLFMGISALSFVEILYFCTIRLCSNIRRRRRIETFDLQPVENRSKYVNNGVVSLDVTK